jgi:diguanylate cyclase (GGDEF)-like protein
MRATTPLTLLLLELDGLERLRAVHGEDAAAALLREVGACIRRRCRFTDEPARYGDDRIGVVLSDTTLAGAELLADDLRAGIAHLRTAFAGVELGITASIGLASLGGELDSREAIVAAAESALREAARGDGDRTVAFTRALGEHDRRAGRSR